MHSSSGSTSAPGFKTLKQREALGRAVWFVGPGTRIWQHGQRGTALGTDTQANTGSLEDPWPPHTPAFKYCPPHLCLIRNTCRSAATLENKSERISKRAVWEESKHGAPSSHCRGPQVPAWAWLGCCLCSSRTSARGLELSAWTWERWGSWLAFEEALSMQPAQVSPGASPAPCLSQSSSAVKSRFE